MEIRNRSRFDKIGIKPRLFKSKSAVNKMNARFVSYNIDEDGGVIRDANGNDCQVKHDDADSSSGARLFRPSRGASCKYKKWTGKLIRQ